MGHLKDISNQPKLQTFPSSTFEIAGDVPFLQCTEALIGGENAQTLFPPSRLQDPGAFTGHNLVGKQCTITENPGSTTGTFAISANNDNLLFLTLGPVAGGPTVYWVHNGGEFILTRNVQSFAEFIHAAGYSYTIKGGKLYTNIPSAQLKPACSIIFDPLT